MKRLALVVLMLFGLVSSLSAKQTVRSWKATTEEEKQKILEYCVIDMKVAISLGKDVVCFSFTNDGYVIVFEDYE